MTVNIEIHQPWLHNRMHKENYPIILCPCDRKVFK